MRLLISLLEDKFEADELVKNSVEVIIRVLEVLSSLSFSFFSLSLSLKVKVLSSH